MSPQKQIIRCKQDLYTLGFLTKISFTPLLYHPGGCLGCPEKRTSSRNYNLFVWSAVFQPKWSNIEERYKNHQNSLKSCCFLGYFQSFFNFGWKTAAQTYKVNLSGSYCFFWHPRHPQRSNNSGDILVFRFLIEFSDLWRHLAIFLLFSKYSPISPLLVLVLKNRYLE